MAGWLDGQGGNIRARSDWLLGKRMAAERFPREQLLVEDAYDLWAGVSTFIGRKIVATRH